MARIVLGVGGGIAAYKSGLLLRRLTEAGHSVQVVPTQAALRFVGAPTWAALSGHPVSTSVWDDVQDVPHVRIGQQAELVVVAPATADLLARAAHGLADDLLTNVLLTARCPVLLAPAMHTEMWLHPATQANVGLLRERGAHVLEPASGRLTGAGSGPGRLPEPDDIADAALALLQPPVPGDLAVLRVLVSAGGTREPLDPVRFIGNWSSGRQGAAVAAVAMARGAKVTLVAGAMEIPAPDGADVVHVRTALEMRAAVLDAAASADVVVMAAAVADFRPAATAAHKIKKSADSGEAPIVTLVRNPDILAELVAARRPSQLIVGFAAETGDEDGDVLSHARAKLARKGCDLLVVNDVSAGKVFGQSQNEVTILDADGSQRLVPSAGKDQVAMVIWDAVVRKLRS